MTRVREALGAVVIGSLVAASAYLGTGSAALGVAVTLLVAVACALFFARSWRGPLPERGALTPALFAGLFVQLLHIGEELLTGFAPRWTEEILGASQAYAVSGSLFAGVNLIGLGLFALGFLGCVRYRRRALAVLLWMAVVLISIAGPVLHLFYAMRVGGYFPGLYTSMLFWVVGPLLFIQMWNPDEEPAQVDEDASKQRLARALHERERRALRGAL